MHIGAEDIIRALPHRFPFLMVDRVTELVPGRKAVALKTLSADAPYAGTARGAASPEMLAIEAMAQVGALAYSLSRTEGVGPGNDGEASGSSGIEGYLAGLNDVVFHIRPKAGDMLELTLEFVAAIGPLARFRGTAMISGNVAVEAGLTFTVEGHK